MIFCIGELLADMIERRDEPGVYDCHAGGAPFNVAVGLAKLKKQSAFYGCVGNDSIGKKLKCFADNIGFYWKQVKMYPNINTTLAFVSLDKFGERSFNFFRKDTADSNLNIDDIDMNIFLSANIIHIGSLMLTENIGQKFVVDLIKLCKLHGKKVSFDVNYREDIFKNENIPLLKNIIKDCDIIKFSSEELLLLSSEDNILKAVRHFDNMIKFVTLGSKGSMLFYNDISVSLPPPCVTVVDTTGAGDAFFAGVLSRLDDIVSIKNALNESELLDILNFGNICGALTATKKGATNAFPTIEEVDKVFYGKS